jgi:hypothetical protein
VAAQCSPAGPVEDLSSRLQDFLAKLSPRAAAANATSAKDGDR